MEERKQIHVSTTWLVLVTQTCGMSDNGFQIFKVLPFLVLEGSIIQMTPYPFPVQQSIVVAAMAMHNFIWKEDMEDQLFTQFSKDDAQVELDTDVEESHGENAYIFDITDRTEMDTKRNSIAYAIWRNAFSDA